MSNFGNKLKKAFTLNEVLENIDYLTEKKSELSIFTCPSNEDRGELTDKDSEDEKTIAFDICHLGRKLLHTEANPPQYYKKVS